MFRSEAFLSSFQRATNSVSREKSFKRHKRNDHYPSSSPCNFWSSQRNYESRLNSKVTSGKNYRKVLSGPSFPSDFWPSQRNCESRINIKSNSEKNYRKVLSDPETSNAIRVFRFFKLGRLSESYSCHSNNGISPRNEINVRERNDSESHELVDLSSSDDEEIEDASQVNKKKKCSRNLSDHCISNGNLRERLKANRETKQGSVINDCIEIESLGENANVEMQNYIELSDDSTSEEDCTLCDISEVINIEKKNTDTGQYIVISDDSVSEDDTNIISDKSDRYTNSARKKKKISVEKSLSPKEHTNKRHRNYNCGTFSDDNVKICDEIKKILLHVEEEEVDFPVPLLHTKESVDWLSAIERLNLLSKGVVIRSGRFSKEEDSIILQNWETIVQKFGISDPFVLLGIGSHSRQKAMINFLKAKHIYVRLGCGLDDRTLSSIYWRARALLNPPRIRNKKISMDEISQIRKLRNICKYQWPKIAQIIGRSQYSCNYAYNHYNKTNKM